MNHQVSPTDSSVQQVARRFYQMIPVYLLIPVVIGVLFHQMFVSINWLAFVLGALGWTIALMLRGPLAFLLRNVPPEKAVVIVGLSSGPLEEGIRVGLLLLTGSAFHWALSIGQGWAAVEVLFVVVNGIAQIKLMQSDDEKAAEAKVILEKQGLFNLSPFLGAIERVFASFFHIGVTLLIAKMPAIVFVLMLVHSLLNFSMVWLSRKNMILSQVLSAVMGTAFLIGGLFVF